MLVQCEAIAEVLEIISFCLENVQRLKVCDERRHDLRAVRQTVLFLLIAAC